MTTSERALADGFRASGLATTAAIAARRPTPLARPLRTARALISSADQDAAHPRWRHWRAMGRATLMAARGRRQPFGRLLPDWEGAAPPPDAGLLADLAAFRRMAPWLPLDGLCLYRSHLLWSYLTALGHRANWMFGVRTWPFRAHCWLQAGDVALDDEAERVSAYHPIMVR
jgi:hypothetical protein